MSSDNPDKSGTPSRGHSADVRIELRVNGQRIPVAQTGRERLILEKPHALAGGTAEVVMSIDGHERRWHVSLRPEPKPSRIVPFDDPQ